MSMNPKSRPLVIINEKVGREASRNNTDEVFFSEEDVSRNEVINTAKISHSQRRSRNHLKEGISHLQTAQNTERKFGNSLNNAELTR